jgi:hypothetical protein
MPWGFVGWRTLGVRQGAIWRGVAARLVGREMRGACRPHRNIHPGFARARGAGKQDGCCRRKNDVSHSMLPAFYQAAGMLNNSGDGQA